jgi:[protein-PII] uridylyltransferase
MTPSNTKTAHPADHPLLHILRARELGGKDYSFQNSSYMDDLLRRLTESHLSAAPTISLLALGGYGRAELCPYSDIDIMFLTDDAVNDVQNAAIEKFLYVLWDHGLKVGHSVRSVKECETLAKKDSKILTSLLDARLVSGNENLAADLSARMETLLNIEEKRAFVQDKLAERDERHKRYGDTRYVLEPNIKEGKGGLRDFQTLMWIARAIYGCRNLDDLVQNDVLTSAEARRFAKSHDFLLTVRCHLHDIAGRAEERLHFDIQPSLAERLGYNNRITGRAVERFMKHYFLVTRDIGDLTRILCASIDAANEPDNSAQETLLGFDTLNDRLIFKDDQNHKISPVEMLRIFRASQETGKDIHPSALKIIARNISTIDENARHDPDTNQIFIEILTCRKAASQTIRRMNESGLLAKFVPDFGKIIALMQFDRYHHFTVDEHIIRCINLLNQLEDGTLKDEAPIASGLMKDITNRNALYVAMFLHDICKGRAGRHAELGAELAHELCPRFGLSGPETDLVSWLIHDHLLMSDTAFKRNMNDPKTIADFSAKIRSQERLDLLLVLTTADIMGVGPGCWTAWKARLLEELYLKTRALMDGEEPGITADITIPDDLKDGETRIDIKTDEAQSATIVIVYTPDRPGLFATLCGALSAEGASIMRAYISTITPRKDAKRIAVDRFIIQNSTHLPFTQERRQDDLRDSIMAALDGTLDTDAKIASYKKPLSSQDIVFNFPPRVELHNNASGSDTVIELETRDRHGLLYDIACVFRDLGLDLRAAKINTQGLRAIDAFYIQTQKHKKLVDLAGQERLIAAIKAKVDKG